MIDSITFQNQALPYGPYNLNNVVNGVGCALKKFEPSIEEIGHTNQQLPYSHGVIKNPVSYGRQLVEMEGDIMHTTPTGYWTERRNMLQHFTSMFPTGYLGNLEFLLTGQAEYWRLNAVVVGYPQIPVGLAGATISPWRIVLAGNDPWFMSANQKSQTIVGLTSTPLTDFGPGNAPSWMEYTIRGPITNPSIDQQGYPGAISISTTISAGQSIYVIMRDRTIQGPGGNLYNVTSFPYGFLQMDPRLISSSGKSVKLNGSGTSGSTQLEVRWYNSYVI